MLILVPLEQADGVEVRPEHRPWNRCYFVGAHSTGKTKLAEQAAKDYGVPLVTEVARQILRNWQMTLEEIQMDPAAVDRFQRECFERQLIAEAKHPRFVSDRACDHLAYAAEHSSITHEIYADQRFQHYMQRLRYAAVFFVRPHKDLVKADGVRTGLDWESVVRIDGMVKAMLKQFGVPYVEIASLAFDERIQTVRAVLGPVKPTC